MRRSRCVPLALIAGASVALAACDQSPVADPAGAADHLRVETGLLAACLPAPAVEVTAVIGLTGGSLSAGGATVTIPPAALGKDTRFHLRVPSSTYAEVEILANDQEHYQFQLPVVIAIDYGRCGTPPGSLTAWHIDPDTKALLENMGGVNDVLNQRVIFSTMHLSGYAIAN